MDSQDGVILQIKQIDFLKGLDDEHIIKILREVIEISFEPDEYILKEGRKGGYFFFLLEGVVSIWEKDEKDELQQITTLAAPSYFGELALIYGTKRTATIKTDTKVKACSLSQESFNDLILSNDRIKENLLESIHSSGRLKKVSLPVNED